LFAALRELARSGEVSAGGTTVGEVADELGGRYGERFSGIAAVSTYVVNGERATRTTPVAEGDELAILPPMSGGASLSAQRPTLTY
jgi:molybdopterin converting factor small subunit